MVERIWPEGAAVINQIRSYSQQCVAVSAWNAFAYELQSEIDLAAALSGFFGDLLS